MRAQATFTIVPGRRKVIADRQQARRGIILAGGSGTRLYPLTRGVSRQSRMFWVPEGFAHGVLTLEDGTDFLYKCTALYAPQSEHTLAWNDPAAGVAWPATGLDPIISGKDAIGLALADVPVFA